MKRICYLLLTLSVIAVTGCRTQNGRASLPELGEAYLAAANAQTQLSTLIPRTHVADDEIGARQLKFEQLTGTQLTSRVIPDGNFPQLAAIQLLSADGEVVDEVPASQIDGRWYLILGHHRDKNDIPSTGVERDD